MTHEVQKSQQQELISLIGRSSKELARALPSHLSPERMTRIALTCLRTNPKLMQCNPQSFMGALFTLAQIGLEPINGLAYLIPYGKEVQAQFGYKGLIDLFYRHASALTIQVMEVRKNDEFNYALGTDAFIKHIPATKDRGDTTYFYAVAHLKNGGTVFEVMSKEDAIEHGKKYSKMFDKSTGKWRNGAVWETDTDAMCKKTVIIKLAKVLPMSSELQQALTVDGSSREYKEGIADMFEIEANYDNDGNKEEAPNKFQSNAPKALTENPESKGVNVEIKETSDTIIDKYVSMTKGKKERVVNGILSEINKKLPEGIAVETMEQAEENCSDLVEEQMEVLKKYIASQGTK